MPAKPATPPIRVPQSVVARSWRTHATPFTSRGRARSASRRAGGTFSTERRTPGDCKPSGPGRAGRAEHTRAAADAGENRADQGAPVGDGGARYVAHVRQTGVRPAPEGRSAEARRLPPVAARFRVRETRRARLSPALAPPGAPVTRAVRASSSRPRAPNRSAAGTALTGCRIRPRLRDFGRTSLRTASHGNTHRGFGI